MTNNTQPAGRLILIGDDATVSLPFLDGMADKRGMNIVDRIEIDPAHLHTLAVVTAEPTLRDAVVRAQSEGAGIWLAYPTDLPHTEHLFQFLGACAMTDVDLFLGNDPRPWWTTILPGLAAAEIVRHVATGWGLFAPAAAGELLAAEIGVRLADPGFTASTVTPRRAATSPQARAARSRGLRRGVAHLRRGGLSSHAISIVLNDLAFPTPGAELKWTARLVDTVPASRDRLNVAAFPTPAGREHDEPAAGNAA